jgi:hypothetical protein
MGHFYIGADPEVFIGNNDGVKSVIGMIGGTKEHPLPLPIGEGFAVQEDNVALEYNIPASKSKELFVDNIASAMEFLESTLRDRLGLHFVNQSAISFPDVELQDPRALVFGCDPDYNAWTGRINRKPKAEDKNLRSCGGHVHIGTRNTEYDGLPVKEIIKACDLFLGVPSVLMDNGVLRKQLYGKAGAYRPKSYGVEYRTLSNFWVFDRRLTAWVYDNVGMALDAVRNRLPLEEDGKLIQSAINENSIPMAERLIEKYSLNVL